MNRLVRRLAATLFTSLAFALPASATTYSIDYTDLWWNPAENGWGINLIQQYEVIFATLFVYGTDNTARWYGASNLSPSGQNVYSGSLYQTTGPWFGTTWTQNAVATPVGSMTLAFNSPTTGTLTYTVNGVTVSKTITRQTWRNNILTGNYVGGLTAVGSACTGATNGAYLYARVFTVQHSGAQVTMTVDFFNGSTRALCTFSGPYSQSGRLGTISNGTWSCTGGLNSQGRFTLSQIDASTTGLSGVFSGNDQYCTYNGYFGGVRDVI